MNFIQRLPGPFCVLDSSFNPPTIAHRALLSIPTTLSRLLLLSTANADKSPTPASYEHRIRMMLILSQSIPHSAVALIDRPTFAEKARYQAELKGATWIMGWDTLIRFFAERYYPEDTMGPVLRTFFIEDGAKVVFAARGEERDVQTLRQIQTFLDKHGISRNCVQEVEIDENLTHVSSSAVRKAIKEQKEWKWMVTEEVAQYIESEGLYME